MRKLMMGLPRAFRRQVVGRGLCGCALLLLTLLLGLKSHDAALALPGLAFGLLALGLAARLLYLADKGRMIEVAGTVVATRQSMLRKRSVELTLDVEGKRLHIRPQRHARYTPGQRLRVFLDTRTPVYDREDGFLLLSYIALEEVEQSPQKMA